MKSELKVELRVDLEQVHRDLLGVLTESRLDAVTKKRLREIAEKLVKITTDIQAAPSK
ncbi:MAG: hypothetical protein JWP89_6918 [Schlesneria sp.]|nr:hypothetical protein [Schlesneria sp.]